MRIRYIGAHDEVLAPDVRFTPIARGEAVEVDDELGARLLEQRVNWEEASGKRRGNVDAPSVRGTDDRGI